MKIMTQDFETSRGRFRVWFTSTGDPKIIKAAKVVRSPLSDKTMLIKEPYLRTSAHILSCALRKSIF